MISTEAWKVVTGETLVADSKGVERPATLLIYHWYHQWLKSVTKRPIYRSGIPLTATHQWWSTQSFAGRSMVDLAEELEPIALEAIGEAVDLYNEEKGPLIAWMKFILHQRLSKALNAWLKESSSQTEDRQRHLSLDQLLAIDGDRSTIVYPSPIEDEPDDVVAVDRELVRTAFAALDAEERQALELYAQGASFKGIARVMNLAGGTSARRIVQRAKEKAQEAMLV